MYFLFFYRSLLSLLGRLKLVPRTSPMSKEILKKNIYANIWKWQEFSFKENMLKTMNDLILALLDIKNDKFKFFTFEKK